MEAIASAEVEAARAPTTAVWRNGFDERIGEDDRGRVARHSVCRDSRHIQFVRHTAISANRGSE